MNALRQRGIHFIGAFALLASVFLTAAGFAQTVPADQASNNALKTYKQRLKEASSLLKDGKLAEALAAAQSAGKVEPNGYEAPAMAALILAQAHQAPEAKAALAAAMSLVPEDKKLSLEVIAKQIDDTLQSSATTSAPPLTVLQSASLDAESQLQMDALMIIVDDAEKATTLPERQKLLREFLDKSGAFLDKHPDQGKLWATRAVAAMELNDAKIGWQAGRNLLALGYINSNDAKVHKTLAMLERKGWLGENPPTATMPTAPNSSDSGLNESTQSAGPTVEQTIAWMTNHFADLACNIHVSGPYDGTQADGSTKWHTYGDKSATYVLIPLDISLSKDRNVLKLRFFELKEWRHLGTHETTYADGNNRDSDVNKTSMVMIHTLAITLKSVSVTDPISPKQDYHFECFYSTDASTAPAPDNAAMSTGLSSYQNTATVYQLLIHQQHAGAIVDNSIIGFAASGEPNQTTTVGITVGNNPQNFDPNQLPPALSSWIDPRQGVIDASAIKSWVLSNVHQDATIGTEDSSLANPLTADNIAICNSNPHVLEKWRQALQRLIKLDSAHGEAVDSLADTKPLTYDQLIDKAAKCVASGDLDGARQSTERALQLDSDQWRGNALMAAILDRQGNFDDAQGYLLKAENTAPRPLPFTMFAKGQHMYVRDIQGIINRPVSQ